jgi:hypothetical protein
MPREKSKKPRKLHSARGNLYFLAPEESALILSARSGSLSARRRLLEEIAKQAVPAGDIPRPIQELVQKAFYSAAHSKDPAAVLVKELGLKVSGRPSAQLTTEQDSAIFSLACDLHGENWRRGRKVRMSKMNSERRNALARSIAVAPQALDKKLYALVEALEQDLEWRRQEASSRG